MDVPEIDPWANESKATIRYLSKRSKKPEAECLVVLRAAQGSIHDALRQLAPELTVFKYPEWYYVGPYKPVDDPDRDLPVREFEYSSSFEWDIDNDRMVQGERLIAPFNDSNSLSDIIGCVLSAASYPEFADSQLKGIGHLQSSLAQAADRIREKLRRNRNPVRAKFFEDAIRFIELAKDCYFDRKYAEGNEAVWRAEQLLRTGNKPVK
jgi:hypothetical protein